MGVAWPVKDPAVLAKQHQCEPCRQSRPEQCIGPGMLRDGMHALGDDYHQRCPNQQSTTERIHHRHLAHRDPVGADNREVTEADGADQHPDGENEELQHSRVTQDRTTTSQREALRNDWSQRGKVIVCQFLEVGAATP